MDLKIKIHKEFISFRNEARNIQAEIKKELKKNSSPEIALDFSEVIFASRSFADELLNVIEEFSREGKKIYFINIKTDVKKLIFIVKRTKEKIRQETL